MNISLLLIGFILCSLASFAGAFFGVRSMSEDAKPLRIPIYSGIKEAVERRKDQDIQTKNERLMKEYFYGKDDDE